MRALFCAALALLAGIGVFTLRKVAAPAWADRAYQLAERRYKAGDLDLARADAERALAWNPRHAAAFALRVEIDLYLGRGREEPLACGYESFMRTRSYEEALTDMSAALARGGRDDLRRVLEYARWFPPTPEMNSRVLFALRLMEPRGCVR